MRHAVYIGPRAKPAPRRPRQLLACPSAAAIIDTAGARERCGGRRSALAMFSVDADAAASIAMRPMIHSNCDDGGGGGGETGTEDDEDGESH